MVKEAEKDNKREKHETTQQYNRQPFPSSFATKTLAVVFTTTISNVTKYPSRRNLRYSRLEDWFNYNHI